MKRPKIDILKIYEYVQKDKIKIHSNSLTSAATNNQITTVSSKDGTIFLISDKLLVKKIEKFTNSIIYGTIWLESGFFVFISGNGVLSVFDPTICKHHLFYYESSIRCLTKRDAFSFYLGFFDGNIEIFDIRIKSSGSIERFVKKVDFNNNDGCSDEYFSNFIYNNQLRRESDLKQLNQKYSTPFISVNKNLMNFTRNNEKLSKNNNYYPNLPINISGISNKKYKNSSITALYQHPKYSHTLYSAHTPNGNITIWDFRYKIRKINKKGQPTFSYEKMTGKISNYPIISIFYHKYLYTLSSCISIYNSTLDLIKEFPSVGYQKFGNIEIFDDILITGSSNKLQLINFNNFTNKKIDYDGLNGIINLDGCIILL